jgi:hypothetical protein
LAFAAQNRPPVPTFPSSPEHLDPLNNRKKPHGTRPLPIVARFLTICKLCAENPRDPAIRAKVPAAILEERRFHGTCHRRPPMRFPDSVIRRQENHMPSFPGASTDPVEELRLRRWARENYVPAAARDEEWHAVVLDEMRRKDEEQSVADDYAAVARRIVPLAPDQGRSLRGPHMETARSTVLLRLPELS